MILAALSLAMIGKVLTFLIVLSILVVLHELGHFIIARRAGVHVDEFAVGMGPMIAGRRDPKTGTMWSLRMLPIGGYCAMRGEDGKSSEAEQQREFRSQQDASVPVVPSIAATDNFQAKTPWQRLGIVVAGPIANFILAYVIVLFAALTFGVSSDTANQPVVGQVVPASPANLAGLQPGDRIVRVGGVAITSGGQLVSIIHHSLNRSLDVIFQRNGALIERSITPKACPVQVNIPGAGCIGFAPVPQFVHVGIPQAFAAANAQYVLIAQNTVGSITMLITHFTKYAPQVSGVVGMGQAAATIQDFGWGPYLGLAATISFALGLFNLLPLPALDGGRAVFIIAELLRGKPVDPEKEAYVHIAGFALLMGLMVVIAAHDIARIASGHGIF